MATGIKKIGDAYDSDWYREEVLKAERGNREHIAKHDRSFSAIMAKADRAADIVKANRGNTGYHNLAARVVEHMIDRLGHERQRHGFEKKESSPMESIEKLEAARVEKLEQIAKSSGVVAVAKHVLVEGPSGLTKADFNRMCNTDWQRDRRSGESYDQCFARHYSAPDALDVRKADQMLGAAAPYFDPQVQVVGGADARDVNDPSAALAALHRIGRERWPDASEAIRFTRAFEANPELAKQAHVRPAATTVYEFPR